MINHEVDRGQQLQTNFSYYSTFHLPKVIKTDSGNYTCAPQNLRPASVFIHIIDEDSNSAAAAIHTAGDENGENGVMAASQGTRCLILQTPEMTSFYSLCLLCVAMMIEQIEML